MLTQTITGVLAENVCVLVAEYGRRKLEMQSKYEGVKKILDLYLDGYIKEANGSFFDLPFPRRERVVKLRDESVSQIYQLFSKTEENLNDW